MHNNYAIDCTKQKKVRATLLGARTTKVSGSSNDVTCSEPWSTTVRENCLYYLKLYYSFEHCMMKVNPIYYNFPYCPSTYIFNIF